MTPDQKQELEKIFGVKVYPTKLFQIKIIKASLGDAFRK